MNLSSIKPDDVPIGTIIEMIEEPSSGEWLVLGTYVVRADYPKLSQQFPSPLLGTTTMVLGTANSRYAQVGYVSEGYVDSGINLYIKVK